MARKDRLKEVYEYVRQNFPIHTQDDFAKALRYNRAYISSAMNGNEKYLTDKLFKNICEAFPYVFNLEYLLTGEGLLLTPEEDAKAESLKMDHDHTIDQSSLVNAALAAKDQTIAQMELRISEKDETIRTQKQLIQSLQQQLYDLRTRYDIQKIEKYPFPMGVAESMNKDQEGVNV